MCSDKERVVVKRGWVVGEVRESLESGLFFCKFEKRKFYKSYDMKYFVGRKSIFWIWKFKVLSNFFRVERMLGVV